MFTMIIVGLGILLGTYMRFKSKKDKQELLLGIIVSVYVMGYGTLAYFLPYLNESFMLYALPLIVVFSLSWVSRRNRMKR